tara:strand:- start:297 stop:599 length:303 start_codon:yes stop_codon:yes gene_type:complete
MDLSTVVSIISLIKYCKAKALVLIKDETINEEFLLNLLFRYCLILDECLQLIEQLLIPRDFLKSDGTFRDTDTVMDLQDCIGESIETENEIGRYLSFQTH